MSIVRRAVLHASAVRFALALLSITPAISTASAGSLTQKDVQILGKAIGFLEPPPSGAATVAVVYDPSNPDSKQDAEAIAGFFGEGLKTGGATLKSKVIEVGQLSAGGFVAVVAASGVKLDQLSGATRALHIACITGDAAAVQAGQCVMAVKTDHKVEILISRAAAASSGVTFGSAFLLMAHAI